MTTLELNPKLGAPFIAKSGPADPDNVLRQIMEEMPEVGEAETWPLFRAEMLKDDDMIEACLRWYHVWARRRLEDLTKKKKKASPPAADPTPAASTADPTAPVSAAAPDKTTVINKIKEAIILDFVMPNGKPLRDCTFGEVGEMGGRFQKIAAAGEPDQIVGTVLSAKQAQAFME